MTFRDVGRLTQKIKRLERKLDTETRSCAYYKRRCTILETILSDIDVSLIPPKGLPQQEGFYAEYFNNDPVSDLERSSSVPDSFSAHLIQEIERNSMVNPQGRRWSISTAMLCYICFSLGRRGYEYFRRFLVLPSPRSLLRRFQGPVEAWKTSLLELSCVPRICDLFRRRHGIGKNDVIDVGIGVDAIAMEEVSVECMGARPGQNHVFAFCLLPLSPKYKHVMLHLMPHHSGNAGKCVTDVCTWLRRALEMLHFNVKFIATDGDTGYNALNEKFFCSWWPTFCSKGLESAVGIVDGSMGAIISDFLHLAKNARSRMINGSVTINPEGLSQFSAKDVNRVLSLGNALTDTSTIGKMKDIYPLQIFTLEDFLKLVHHGELSSAFYILPYAMWAEVLRNRFLSHQVRLDLLDFVIDIFAHHEECLHHLDRSRVSEKKSRSSMCQYFCSTSKCHRTMNTLLVLIAQLRTHQNIALDRIGTHCLECSFGVVRLLCQYKHSWGRILKSFSQLLLITDFMTILGSVMNPRSRVNDAGIKLYEDQSNLLYIPCPDVRMREVYDVVNTMLAHRCGSNTFGQEVLQEMAGPLAEFLNYLTAIVTECNQMGESTAKLWPGNEISNRTILARLIAFCHKPDSIEPNEEEHSNHGFTYEPGGDDVVDVITEGEDFSKCVTPMENTGPQWGLCSRQ